MLPSHSLKLRWRVASSLALMSMVLSVFQPLRIQAQAEGPAWWISGEVTNSNAVQNNAVANIGQLKNIANATYTELQNLLPYGDGYAPPFDVPDSPDQEWYTEQKKVVNLGQLKAVAQPLYDIINAISPDWVERQLNLNGLSSLGEDYHRDPNTGYFYPWNPDTPVSDNYAVATIGQLKVVFSLYFYHDVDHAPNSAGVGSPDGMPDLWEWYHIRELGSPDYVTPEDLLPVSDPDEDCLMSLTEYELRKLPFVIDKTPVVWKDMRHSITEITEESGSMISKVSGHTRQNAGGRSALSIVNSGFVEVTLEQPEPYASIALSSYGLNYWFYDYEYTIYVSNDDRYPEIRLARAGSFIRPEYKKHEPGDVYKIERCMGQINFIHNGVVFYSMEAYNDRPLYAFAGLRNDDDSDEDDRGSTITHSSIGGYVEILDADFDGLVDEWEMLIVDADLNDDITEIEHVLPVDDFDGDFLSNAAEFAYLTDPVISANEGWMDLNPDHITSNIELFHPEENLGSSLKKVSRDDGFDATAHSSIPLVGDGGITARVNYDNTNTYLGLTLQDPSDRSDAADITYCFGFVDNETVVIFENGLIVEQRLSYFGPNDSFSIERDGDTVYYLRNGRVVHVAELRTTAPLYVDSALPNPGLSVTHLSMCGFAHPDGELADQDGDGISYDYEYLMIDYLNKGTITSSTNYIQQIDDTTDLDQDGTSNLAEFIAGSDPLDIENQFGDTDEDGFTDYWETRYGYDQDDDSTSPPEDRDGDGLTVQQEIELNRLENYHDSDLSYTYYVDADRGCDFNYGKGASLRTPISLDGPLQTIKSLIEHAERSHTKAHLIDTDVVYKIDEFPLRFYKKNLRIKPTGTVYLKATGDTPFLSDTNYLQLSN